MENKHTFQARLEPYFAPSDLMDIKLSYVLAKFGHRAQVRQELIEGKPTRYFEHVRRVALILIDDMKMIDKKMIISAILHDTLEDCGDDISAELLENSFGPEVVGMIKYLSKMPKEGYIDRLNHCKNWRVLAIKACDRLDNVRSLMVEGTTEEFQERQVKETEEKYFPIFDKLLKLCPPEHLENVTAVVDEIKSRINACKIIINGRKRMPVIHITMGKNE